MLGEIKTIIAKTAKGFENEILKCWRCGHEMLHKIDTPMPTICGRCKSVKWNVPRDNE